GPARRRPPRRRPGWRPPRRPDRSARRGRSTPGRAPWRRSGSSPRGSARSPPRSARAPPARRPARPSACPPSRSASAARRAVYSASPCVSSRGSGPSWPAPTGRGAARCRPASCWSRPPWPRWSCCWSTTGSSSAGTRSRRWWAASCGTSPGASARPSVAPAPASATRPDAAGPPGAPLTATAARDLALGGAARLGAPVDFSLRRGKLVAATLAVGGAFAAVKLSPAAAGWLERAAAAAGLDWRIAADPTDLVALPALAAAVWLGRREIARVPLGRLAVVERRWRAARVAPSGQLADVVACGGDPELVAALAAALERYLDGGPAAPAEEAL